MEHIILALITSLPGAIAALLSWRQSKRNHSIVADTKRELGDIHIEVNDRLSQLLALTHKSAHAEGRAEGLAENQSMN